MDEKPTMVIETDSSGFVMGVTFNRLVRSQDAGGQEVAEVVMTFGDMIELYERDILEVWNPRPDHDPTVSGSGKKGWAKTPDRLKNWSNDVLGDGAILGNLSYNINPNARDSLNFSRDGRSMTLRNGKITTLDGATRTRAVLRAYALEPEAVDLNLLVSVRFWFLPSPHDGDVVSPGELTAEAVFASYQNTGKAVAGSVVHWHYPERDGLAFMIKQFVVGCPTLAGSQINNWGGEPDNVLTKGDRLSVRSRELWTYNWIYAGFRKSWYPWVTGPLIPSEDNLKWLWEFMSIMTHDHPELEIVDEDTRREYRQTLITPSDTGARGIMGLAARMRREGADFSILEKLNEPVTLTEDSPVTHGPKAGQQVPFLSLHNPEFLSRRVVDLVVVRGSKDKVLRAGRGWDSRDELKKILWERVGLSLTTTNVTPSSE